MAAAHIGLQDRDQAAFQYKQLTDYTQQRTRRHQFFTMAGSLFQVALVAAVCVSAVPPVPARVLKSTNGLPHASTQPAQVCLCVLR